MRMLLVVFLLVLAVGCIGDVGGLAEGLGNSGQGVSGFDNVRIEDYAFDASGFTVDYENAAGQTMKEVVILYSGDVTGTSMEGDEEYGWNWAPGKEYTYSVESGACSTPAAKYNVDITITYKLESGMYAESGKINGECE